ncbi:unnamed protein product, partial [Hapterophycus canaliculatus]
RCFRCGKRGHREANCTTKERGFVTLCMRCGGAGHSADTGQSEAAVLAFDMLSPKAEAAEPVILDSGASSTMFASDDSFSSYRECEKRVRVGGKRVLPIAGQGDAIISLRSAQGRTPLQLRDVFHVPQFDHNLMSFRDVLAAGHDV